MSAMAAGAAGRGLSTRGLLVAAMIGTAAGIAELDRVTKLVWGALADGHLAPEDAEGLDAMLLARRRAAMAPPAVAIGGPARRLLPRAKRGKEARAAARERRRMLGGSSALPAAMRKHYTEAMRSVLCVVAAEVKRQGVCELCIDAIAALAGVCRTTVRTALHEARRLGHVAVTERPRRGRKSLTNAVRIVSAKWLAWVARAPNAARGLVKTIGSKFFAREVRNGDPQEDHRKKVRGLGGAPGPVAVPWGGGLGMAGGARRARAEE